MYNTNSDIIFVSDLAWRDTHLFRMRGDSGKETVERVFS